MIDCPHFSGPLRADGGICLAGLHKGKPSFGTCRICPHKNKSREKIAALFRPLNPSTPQPSSTDWSVLGPQMWGKLHTRAREYDGNAGAAAVFLILFTFAIPCGDCKRHWLEMLKRSPPDLSSAEAYYQWTVDRHNEVNLRLGKAQFLLVKRKNSA